MWWEKKIRWKWQRDRQIKTKKHREEEEMRVLLLVLGILLLTSSYAQARIRYINSYTRTDGTIVSGHYRDTSNDGYSYNNANCQGYNNRPYFNKWESQKTKRMRLF